MNIVREDPPPEVTGRRPLGFYVDIAAKLRADPGNWYRILEKQTNPEIAQRIKKGEIAAFRPAGSFEATARSGQKGTNKTWTIWARYVGTEES